MFNQNILTEIRDRLPISAFIGERIPLKKAGRNFKGLCPFHQEKTPSFIVSDEKQIYHCFGCGEGGDVFKFLMKYEGLTFAEAVKQLADRTGVTLPKDTFKNGVIPDAGIAKKKKWCYRVNSIVAEYFHERLLGPAGAPARNYLKSRDILEKFWTQHFLGYAEKRWDGLVRHLMDKQVPLELAAELGLIKQRDSSDGKAAPEEKFYDFFRNRLVFPIVSSRKEVIGFSARALDEEDANQVKYLNSPDSIIYHKSGSVYGLHVAKEAIRKEDLAILVEGNIDLIALNQAGLKNVVAPLGTALTTGHIRLLSRFSKNMTLVFDGDEAGVKASERALPLFIEMNIVPRAVALPNKEDPDSFIKKRGPDEFRELLQKAPTLFEQVVNLTAKRMANDTAGRIAAMRHILPYLKEIKDPVEMDMYKSHIAKVLHIKEETLEEAIKSKKKKEVVDVKQKTSKRSSDSAAERLLVETMIRLTDTVPLVLEKVTPDQFSDRWCRTIADMFANEWRKEGKVNLSHLLGGVADPDLASELRTMAVAENDLSDSEARQLIDDCVEVMRRRTVNESIERLNEQIKEAEAEGNENRIFELLAKKQEAINLNHR